MSHSVDAVKEEKQQALALNVRYLIQMVPFFATTCAAVLAAPSLQNEVNVMDIRSDIGISVSTT